MDPDYVSIHKHVKKWTWLISSHLDRIRLASNPPVYSWDGEDGRDSFGSGPYILGGYALYHEACLGDF